MSDQDIQIELFPLKLKKEQKGKFYKKFDINKFYAHILLLDIDEINANLIDTSDKIFELKSRLKQKEFK